MENPQTFTSQLLGGFLNKLLFFGLALLTLTAWAYNLTGLDEPVDRLSAHYIELGAAAIFAINTLVTWLHGEKQSRRGGLTFGEGCIVAGAVILSGFVLANISPWAFAFGLPLLGWVAAFRQPNTRLTTVDPMEATPMAWGVAIMAGATVAFGLGIAAGLLF